MQITDLLNLTTIGESDTWTCPVYFLMDQSGKIYCITELNSMHMKHITLNPEVTMTITENVHIRGKAKILPVTDRFTSIYHSLQVLNQGEVSAVDTPIGWELIEIVPFNLPKETKKKRGSALVKEVN